MSRRRGTRTSRRRGTRTGRALRRYAAVALGPVAAGLVLLAACGSVPAPAPGTAGNAPARASGSPAAVSASPSAGSGSGSGSAQVPLCRDAAAVTGLDIVRIGGIRVPEAQIGFPAQARVVSPAQARAVARALCALPTMPHGFLSCPALFPGTNYQLRFMAAGRPLPVVTIEATGCETVAGVGPLRRAISPGFWRVLATAVGLSPPGRAVFSAPGCEPHGYPTKIDGCPALSRPAGVQPGASDVPVG